MITNFLVFDAGTGAGRALIINEKGDVISSAYSEWSYKKEVGIPGGYMYDPLELVNVLIDTGAHAVADSKVDPETIRAVAATSLREGVIFIDKQGKELYLGPNFDERAAKEGEKLANDLGRELYLTSGTYPPAYGYAARLNWFKNHRLNVYKRINKILTLGDWITWKLSGELISEPSLASASGIFDVSSRDWSWSLVDQLGIDVTWLPPIHCAGEQVGKLKNDIAERLGLTPETLVTIGGGDTQCSILGMGLVQHMQSGCVAGTTSPVQQLTDHPIFDVGIRTWTNCHTIPDIWCLESNAIVTGLAFRWIRDCLFKGLSYDRLNALIDNTPIGSHGTLAFLGAEIMNMSRYRASWTGGFLFPVPAEEIGLGDLARATLESNAYAIRGNIEQIIEISNLPIHELHLSGGQTASKVGMKIFADVLGIPLYIHGQHSASIGTAICAAVCAGVYGSISEAVDNMVHEPQTLESTPENVHLYQEYYEKWRSHYHKIRKLNC